jgi:hypothetical protein
VPLNTRPFVSNGFGNGTLDHIYSQNEHPDYTPNRYQEYNGSKYNSFSDTIGRNQTPPPITQTQIELPAKQPPRQSLKKERRIPKIPPSTLDPNSKNYGKDIM